MSKMSSDGVTFLCGMCIYSTEDDKAFLNHYGDQHKREMAYWCRECGRTFTSPAQLILHIKHSCTKVKSVMMKCGIASCSFSGLDPFQFMQHIKIVHKGTHLFPCFKCRKLFTIPSCLIQHIQTECAEAESSDASVQPKTPNPAKHGKNPRVVTSEKNLESLKKAAVVIKRSNHVEDDPDDPDWTFPTSETKQHTTRNDTGLHSDIEIYSMSNNKAVKIRKGPNHRMKRLENPIKNGTSSNHDAVRQSDEDNNCKEPSTEKESDDYQNHRAICNTKKKDDNMHQTPHRYERWNDWWKAMCNRKSSPAMEYLLREENIRHFFTCMSFNCRYSTNDEIEFITHQSRDHPTEKVPCRYCLRELDAGFTMAEHSVSAHGTRRYQCSSCLYRASTKSQVALHFEAMHGGKPNIFTCQSISPEEEVVENADTEVAMPYICRVGRCKYETCNPEEFVAHNQQMHTGVSVYPCFYCGAETFKLDALMRHYRLHGIYNFQCAHCVHGTNTIEEILFHQCLNHAERRMQVYVRPSSSANNEIPASEELEQPLYPVFFPDYASSFNCGVEGCNYNLFGLKSYREHLLAAHYCNSYFPCPHCTAILKTTVNLEEHLATHGPNLYACGSRGCKFYHSTKSVVETHCREKHQDVLLIVVRESNDADFCREIKKEPEDLPTTVSLNYQLLGSVSVDSNANLGTGIDSFSGNVQDETSSLNISEVYSEIQTQDNETEKGGEDFGCLFCDFNTTSWNVMQAHLYKELKYFPFQCKLCNTKESELSCIREHIADKHPSAQGTDYDLFYNEKVDMLVTNFLDGGLSLEKAKWNKTGHDSETVCPLCDTVTVPIDGMYRHLANHLSYRPHACLFCEEKFLHSEAARVHAVVYHDAGEGTFTTYSPIARIESWLIEMAAKLDGIQTKKTCYNKDYTCAYCSFGPTKLEEQKQHVSDEHPGKRLRLKRHNQSVYPDAKRKQMKLSLPMNVTCEKCGHVNMVDKNPQEHQPKSKNLRGPLSKTGFSFYRKPDTPIDLDNVWVRINQGLPVMVRIPVQALMKIMNFKVCIRLQDLKHTLYRPPHHR